MAQNVGIGTTNPTGPLSFASNLGNKLVLWGDGNSAHYGIGVQGGYLQLYADIANSSISFGYGRSSAFIERARIFNTGLEGMYLNGRLHLRNGEPANAGGGGGVWLYNPANTAQIGFMGTQNSQNIGFYGGAAGWGFTYDVINSRVGIGNNAPNAPLAFAATLGKKITLFPGASGDVGFGVSGNRLQIYSDNPNADVAIGYDAAGTFNERFAVKANGALAVAGIAGQSGQVLASNGNAASPQWRSIGELLGPQTTVISGGQDFFLGDDNLRNGTPINFTMLANSRLLVWAPVSTYKPCSIGPCQTAFEIKVYLDGGLVETYTIQGTAFPGALYDEKSVGPIVLNPAPGAHTLSFTLQNKFGNPVGAYYPQLVILGN